MKALTDKGPAIPLKPGKPIRAPAISVRYGLRGAESIVVRVTISGQPRTNQRATGQRATASTFDPDTQTIRGDPASTALLKALEAEILRVFADFRLTGRPLDANRILDVAMTERDPDGPRPTVIEGINLYMIRQQARLGADIKIGSWKRYRTYGGLLRQFISSHPAYGKHIRFDELKPALRYHLIDDFLKGTKNFGHNYSIKIFSFFKSMIEYAIAHEWADRNPVRYERVRKFQKAVVTLDMADLDKLRVFEFAEPTANLVRDCFIFQINTGLAYVDLAALSPAHVTTSTGIRSLLLNRQKTGVESFIPLFPEALAILDKYADHPVCLVTGRLLPVLSNQKMNNWLKIIGNTVGIRETLHTHLGRRTFTMLAESYGFSVDDMAVMLGHVSAEMTRAAYHKKRKEPVLRRYTELFTKAETGDK